MFGFGGLSEVMFILFLAMLIFGPEKLPEIGRMLAKGMAEVRKASNELKRTLNVELAASEQEAEARRNAQAPGRFQAPVVPPPAAWSGDAPAQPAMDLAAAPAAQPALDPAAAWPAPDSAPAWPAQTVPADPPGQPAPNAETVPGEPAAISAVTGEPPGSR